MFGRGNKDNPLWKLEYIDTVYKIYDWDKNLTGYFFPNYDIDVEDHKDKDKDKINFKTIMKLKIKL